MTTLRHIADKLREADETGAAGYEDLARVAVAAMRDPGSAMGINECDPYCWESMIDHILNET